MHTVLYLGMTHRPNDPRLCYREMKALAENCSRVCFVFLTTCASSQPPGEILAREKRTYGGIKMEYIQLAKEEAPPAWPSNRLLHQVPHVSQRVSR